jgi:ATP adenylyltransferase
MNLTCPFCHLEPEREIIAENVSAFSIFDKFPVSKGHALIVPRRHCSDYFELSTEEQAACWDMMNTVKQIIYDKFRPDGFNIGINAKEAAGQTISHVHIHLIPRYKGDVKDPEGGVRGVIPEKKIYTET